MQHALAIGDLMGEWARSEVAVPGWDVRDCVALLRDLHDEAVLHFEDERAKSAARWPIPPRERRAAMTDEDWAAWFREHPPPPVDWHEVRESIALVNQGRGRVRI
jgi:hypothetical protein